MFSVGQKVIIKEYEDMKTEYGTTDSSKIDINTHCVFTDEMIQFCGQIATINETYSCFDGAQEVDLIFEKEEVNEEARFFMFDSQMIKLVIFSKEEVTERIEKLVKKLHNINQRKE